ncbi:MAG: phosphatase PAP2 family protein [Alphaproteobacteria bacterium]|nr:phosphatase PAP2 family protein [Alphaproteobacteria bacterium]
MEIFYTFVGAVTDFGESSLLFAIATAIAIYLVWRGRWRAGLVFMLAFLLVAAGIGLLKMIFIGCAVRWLPVAVHSPSGHTAMAAVVLGTIAAMTANGKRGWRRYGPLILALVLVAAIAATRVILEVHSVAEVAIGFFVGGGVAGGAAYCLRREKGAQLEGPALAIALVLAGGLFYGTHVPVEKFIRNWAASLQTNSSFCRFFGGDIHAGK